MFLSFCWVLSGGIMDCCRMVALDDMGEPFFCVRKKHTIVVSARGAIVKKLAQEFGAVFIPLQAAFDHACTLQPASYWLADGVHPTPAGHQLIANAWLEAFRQLISLS